MVDPIVKAMSTIFRSLPSFRDRFEELKLQTRSDWSGRNIISLANTPKVGMADVSTNWEYLAAIIEQDNDAIFKCATLMEAIFADMDRCCEFQMSAQSESGLRSFVHRFEGGKLRLVWSKFLRELKRAEFSEER